MEHIQSKSSKEIVLEFFEILFNPDFFDLDKMDSLLGESFEQHSDGRVRDRTKIMKHFEGHKQMKQTSTIDFVAILGYEDVVFADYIITSHKAKGTTAKWRVLGKYTVVDGKLAKSEQLSEVIESE